MLTDMSQPLGYTVGNALEVREAIETLRPDLPAHPRFEALVRALAGQAFALCGLEPDAERGRARAERLLRNGDALEKFRLPINCSTPCATPQRRWRASR
jgi:thymidine phosphorylase